MNKEKGKRKWIRKKETALYPLAVLRWHASTFYIYQWRCEGDHTLEAYSSCGLTRVLYANDFRNPSVWIAFLDILPMWVLHVRSSQIVTPRYFSDETFSSSVSPVSCRTYSVSIGVLRRVTWRTWHLEKLTFISHIFSHCGGPDLQIESWMQEHECKILLDATSYDKLQYHLRKVLLLISPARAGHWWMLGKEECPEPSPAGRQRRRECRLNFPH